MDAYLQLIQTIATPAAERGAQKALVMFAAALPGEGTSYVSLTFGERLAAYTNRRVLVADAARLRRLDLADCMRLADCCRPTNVPNLCTLRDEDDTDALEPTTARRAPHEWQRDPEFSFDALKALRFDFDHVLVDCRSLKESSEAALLAPHTNGVVLVVEADRARREQIVQAQKVIRNANGELLGCVLNKRRYSVPSWLYHRM